MSSNSIRVGTELFERAREQGALMSRSAAQQLEHWARLGAALEASGLTVTDVVRMLQDRHRGNHVHTEVAPERDLWAFKRARQAQDLENIRAGTTSNDEMSWFSRRQAKAAKLVSSAL